MFRGVGIQFDTYQLNLLMLVMFLTRCLFLITVLYLTVVGWFEVVFVMAEFSLSMLRGVVMSRIDYMLIKGCLNKQAQSTDRCVRFDFLCILFLFRCQKTYIEERSGKIFQIWYSLPNSFASTSLSLGCSWKSSTPSLTGLSGVMAKKVLDRLIFVWKAYIPNFKPFSSLYSLFSQHSLFSIYSLFFLYFFTLNIPYFQIS